MSEPVLRIENLTRVYKKGSQKISAVSNAFMKVEKGQRVIIHGPSGAGKSTLLELAGGLLRPTSGKVFHEGVDIYRVSGRKLSKMRTKKLGFVFQFYHLLPELNVLENVMIPALMAGGSWRSAKKEAKLILRDMGLSERIKHKPAEISGGEAQRVAIARALINEPELLLCDEPTGNLDSRSGEEVWMTIKNLSEQRGMSVLAVSHDVRDEGIFNAAYRMTDGLLERL